MIKQGDRVLLKDGREGKVDAVFTRNGVSMCIVSGYMFVCPCKTADLTKV